jgi:hypothetical protein
MPAAKISVRLKLDPNSSFLEGQQFGSAALEKD